VIVVLAASALAALNKSLNTKSFFACPYWSNALLLCFFAQLYGDKYPKSVIKLM
jgi:hypothetical protein